jgi:hypothetical protein
MSAFGPAVVFGLCFGFLFGTGCSLAILYSIYLDALEKLKRRRAQEAAAAK